MTEYHSPEIVMSRRAWMQVASTCLEIIEGDLSDLDTDAIVNAASADLVLGGGVAGAIARRGGPAIQEECDRYGPIRVGEAALTGGGDLAARHVIHAVGPRLGEGEEEKKLTDATLNALALAEARDLRSIGFPAISTGVCGFPVDRCAAIMLGTIIAFLAPGARLERVVICLWGEESFDSFARELEAQRAEDESS